MNRPLLLFRVHAIERMRQRRVREYDVREVLLRGQTIENYPDDFPYPSRLVLGWVGGRPLHVVVAENRMDNQAVVITVYEPDQAVWESGFRRRKRQ